MTKKTEPLVTIIIPIGKLSGNISNLRRTLASAKLGSCEFILVLDCKENENPKQISELIQEFVNKDITLVEGSFGSPGLARNHGMSLATGEWLWFCDSDDFAEVDVVIESLTKNPPSTDFVVFNFKRVNELTGTEYINPGPLDEFSIALNPGIWRILLRKGHKPRKAFGNFRLGEDQLFIVENGIFNSPITFRDYVVYSYSFGGAGHLVDKRDSVSDLAAVFKIVTNILLKSNGEKQTLLYLMAMKQFVTLMRIGNFLLKLSICKNVIGILFCSPKSIYYMAIQLPEIVKRKLVS